MLEPSRTRGTRPRRRGSPRRCSRPTRTWWAWPGSTPRAGPAWARRSARPARAGQVVATCVEAEEQHLRLRQGGRAPRPASARSASCSRTTGVMTLDAIAHPRADLPARAGGGDPPVARRSYNTGTYTVTRETVDLFFAGAKSADDRTAIRRGRGRILGPLSARRVGRGRPASDASRSATATSSGPRRWPPPAACRSPTTTSLR